MASARRLLIPDDEIRRWLADLPPWRDDDDT